MTSVETENAVMRENARIRVEVIRISDQKGIIENGIVYIPREEVLKALK